jgi:glycosyltransferase involved in cell wall biosynthesis
MIQVTAITAAYNAASYIENCIQSVLAQTVPCRMVIVDDASRDDTYAIAMRYAEEYPDRITVLMPGRRHRATVRLPVSRRPMLRYWMRTTGGRRTRRSVS